MNLSLDRSALVYEQLRFRAHGGRFVARGEIPLTSERTAAPKPDDAPLLALELEEGGAELAAALGQLAGRLHVAREGDRPPEEIWLPEELTARGHLSLHRDLSLSTDLTLETPAGTAVALAVRLARGGGLDGSTLRGAIGTDDLVTSGVIGPVAILASATGRRSSTSMRLHVVAAMRSSSVDGSRPNGSRSWHQGSTRQSSSRVWPRGGAWTTRAWCGTASRRIPTKAACRRLVFTSGAGGSMRVRRSRRSPCTRCQRSPGARPRASFGGCSPGRSSRAGTVRSTRLASWSWMLPHSPRSISCGRRLRFGLRPPNEDASAPVTALVVGSDWGLSLRDVKLDLRGATVRGELGISRERALDGHAEVTLEEEYLRTSKVLTLPRVFTDRLVFPVHVDGPLNHPRVHADLGATLGSFLKDNRVSAFVTSAVEEAQIPPRASSACRAGAIARSRCVHAPRAGSRAASGDRRPHRPSGRRSLNVVWWLGALAVSARADCRRPGARLRARRGRSGRRRPS